MDKKVLAMRLMYLYLSKYRTQTEMAKDIGATDCQVCNWLAGRKTPRVENLIKIADAFGVTLDYLVGRSDEKFRSQ